MVAFDMAELHHPAYLEAGLISILSAINQSLFCLIAFGGVVAPFLFPLACFTSSYV